jgi:hypothetical protein
VEAGIGTRARVARTEENADGETGGAENHGTTRLRL